MQTNQNYTYKDLTRVLDKAYEEKETRIEKAFSDVFKPLGSALGDMLGKDRLSKIMDEQKKKEEIKAQLEQI